MLSVLIPANNEADRIGACLQAVLDSVFTEHKKQPEIIVVANGCNDNTAMVANDYTTAATAAGWRLRVLDLQQGGKLSALNAGDAAASYGNRIYLDADVIVSPLLVDQLQDVLTQKAAIYASGAVEISPSKTWVSRAYRRIYRRVPFIAEGVPGCGIFAVNAAGRGRWDKFPNIISDDTFVRLHFVPDERIGVPAPYQWPIVEGFANLVRVRRRQDAGVNEIAAKYPQLLRNDDKAPFGLTKKFRLAMSDPAGFAVYALVAIVVRLGGSRASENWSRGR